jgi:uncharacterized iron-regulated membrane protein
VSALFDREHPPRRQPRSDEDTAEIPIPTVEPPQPDDPDPAADQQRRPQPQSRATRLKAALLLGAYTSAALGSVWLTVLAFLRLNAIVMALMVGAAIWLGGDGVRLARWYARPHATTRPPLSRLQRLIACVLAVLYAYLLVDWLLHQ